MTVCITHGFACFTPSPLGRFFRFASRIFLLIVAMHVYDSEDAAVVQGLLGLPWEPVVPHQEQWVVRLFSSPNTTM